MREADAAFPLDLGSHASLEAQVTVHTADAGEYAFLCANAGILPAIFITSDVHVANDAGGAFKGETVGVDAAKAAGVKCERCWGYSETVGSDPKHPTLCARCAQILGE